MKRILQRMLVILPALFFSLVLAYWLFRVELVETISNPTTDLSKKNIVTFTEPAYKADIFSAADTSKTILCWNTPLDSFYIESELNDAVHMITSKGYRLSFLLYDLNSGNGISYRSTEGFYCASAIKGPYVACIVETLPICMDRSSTVMEETIQISSNDGYRSLWNTYGTKTFIAWVKEAGCEYLDASKLWPEITAHDLALLWVKMYDSFTADTEYADWLSDLYLDTFGSFLSKTLGNSCTVYSKAGWINSSEYYTARNDAGIVMKQDHPYVLVVLSNAYGQDELLGNLVRTLDTIHTSLLEYN